MRILHIDTNDVEMIPPDKSYLKLLAPFSVLVKNINFAQAEHPEINYLDTINVKKIAFGKKEHITDKKMGVSVLLRLFISSNEVCNTA